MSRTLHGHLELQISLLGLKKFQLFSMLLQNTFQLSKKDYWNLHVAMVYQYSLSLCLLTEHLQPFYLQWTVTLTVAVAGVSTPLLAVHWYWIMLPGVPGLLIFTMVSDVVLESTSEVPSFVHVMAGWGLPDALHKNVMLFPSMTFVVVVSISAEGASENVEQLHC